MKMLVCSHCWTNVVPTSAGNCPCCRSRIDGPSPYIPLTVRSGTTLPPHCVVCDVSVRRWKNWKAAYRPTREALPPVFHGALGLFLHAWDSSRHLAVRLKIPLCHECELIRQPRGDFENANVEIIVDRRFAARCEPPRKPG